MMKSRYTDDRAPRTALMLSAAAQPLPTALTDFRAAWTDDLTTLEIDLRPDRATALWAMQIDHAVRGRASPILVVAHGECCLALAHWAQLSPASYTAMIAGAVFHLPSAALASRPPGLPASSPRVRLPFPSVLVSDTGRQIDGILAQADIWGSRFVDTAAPDSIYRSDLRGVDSTVYHDLMTLLFEQQVASIGGANGPNVPNGRRTAVLR